MQVANLDKLAAIAYEAAMATRFRLQLEMGLSWPELQHVGAQGAERILVGSQQDVVLAGGNWIVTLHREQPDLWRVKGSRVRIGWSALPEETRQIYRKIVEAVAQAVEKELEMAGVYGSPW
ncbi:MAG: hypothetical protein V3U28_06690 [Candidatus Acidoferrales bacterium]